MKWTQALFSNYFKRYIERELHKGKVRRQWHPLTGWKEMKKKKFLYNEHRPWTDEFKLANPLGKKTRMVVEPIKEWKMFKGDRVEILVGKDEGKQGIINCIIKERNWVFVEGLNNKYTQQAHTADTPPVCVRKEQPLLVTSQVKLVDPSNNQATDVVWRYTEEGERVRVSVDTGQIIPVPDGAAMMEDLVIPSSYSEGDKDTKNKQLTAITFKPKLCTFEEDIMESLNIKEDRKPAKTYWY